MPIHKCYKNGKPGYQWGGQKCYTYEPGDEKSRKEAYEKCVKQMRAIYHSGYRGSSGLVSEFSDMLSGIENKLQDILSGD